MSAQAAVTVIGAGPVGSLLACMLAQRGIAVEVYERRGDMRRADVGAGRSINLAVSARGLGALTQVGLDGAVLDCTVPMAGRMIHAVDGQQRLLPYGRDASQQIHSMSRGGLNRLLMDRAEATGRVRMHFQQRLVSWDPDAHTVTLVDEVTGEQHTRPAAVVIGTDGSASAVRDTMVRRAGHQVAVDPLDFGYKELTMPPVTCGHGPSQQFSMAPHALHIWPRGRHMLIALPNPDGSFTATLFLPHLADPRHPQTPAFERLSALPDIEALFERDFADAVAGLYDPAEQFMRAPLGHMATIRTRPWNLGPALLLGDAAHAIVPFFGQGMNAGFEDCTVLAGLLDDLGHFPTPLEWAQLFATFQDGRKPDADAIADLALENFVEMRDHVADPEFLLQRAIEAEIQARLGERYWTRYQLVSFSRVPYRAAKRIGALQAEVLSRAARGKTTIQDVDLDAAVGEMLAVVVPELARLQPGGAPG